MQLRSTHTTLVDDNVPGRPSSPQFNDIGNVSWPSIANLSATGCPLANVSGGALVVGCFEFVAAQPARKAVLLMNFEAAFNVYAKIDFGRKMMEVSQQSGEDIPIVSDAPAKTGLHLFFEPGAGRLFVESTTAAGVA